MKKADIGGVEIAYLDEGEGRPVFLIHGFASKATVNWVQTGWTALFAKAGRRVVALDNRGHGDSEKFYKAEDYGPDIFASDSLRLLDYLGIERVDLMGYSMGARISAWIAHTAPERVNRLVFGGMGDRMFKGGSNQEIIAHGLETDDPDSIEDKGARAFRAFADRTGSDRMALAACIRPSRTKITQEIVSSIRTPTLIAVGSDDNVAGSPENLAKLMPNADVFVIPGRDHMKAVGDPTYKKAVNGFFGNGRNV